MSDRKVGKGDALTRVLHGRWLQAQQQIGTQWPHLSKRLGREPTVSRVGWDGVGLSGAGEERPRGLGYFTQHRTSGPHPLIKAF